MTRLLVTLAFLLLPVVAEAAVVFEAVGSNKRTVNGTTLNVSITLGGASSTRAVVVGVACSVNLTGMAATIGGEAMSVITGTTTTVTIMLGKATALTGAQTVALSWTSSQLCVAGVISATGVDQTTPFENGTNSGSGVETLQVTSTSGDLTTTVAVDFAAPLTTDQTEKWAQTTASFMWGHGDIGPGTGTTTHTWTTTPGRISGVNFNAAPVTAGGGVLGSGIGSGGVIQ